MPVNSQPSRCCAICGRAAENSGAAYFLSTSPEGEKLQVLNWDRRLAKIPGVRIACQPAHVIEIAAHWMATGSLELTFANLKPDKVSRPHQSAERALPRIVKNHAPDQRDDSMADIHFVGELCVDRASLPLAFVTQPELLATLLGALLEILERAERSIPPRTQLTPQTDRPASAA